MCPNASATAEWCAALHIDHAPGHQCHFDCSNRHNIAQYDPELRPTSAEIASSALFPRIDHPAQRESIFAVCFTVTQLQRSSYVQHARRRLGSLVPTGHTRSRLSQMEELAVNLKILVNAQRSLDVPATIAEEEEPKSIPAPSTKVVKSSLCTLL